MMHQGGYPLPDRGDGLNWLKCTECGREWAEKDSGAFAKGSRTCNPVVVVGHGRRDGSIEHVGYRLDDLHSASNRESAAE